MGIQDQVRFFYVALFLKRERRLQSSLNKLEVRVSIGNSSPRRSKIDEKRRPSLKSPVSETALSAISLTTIRVKSKLWESVVWRIHKTAKNPIIKSPIINVTKYREVQ